MLQFHHLETWANVTYVKRQNKTISLSFAVNMARFGNCNINPDDFPWYFSFIPRMRCYVLNILCLLDPQQFSYQGRSLR